MSKLTHFSLFSGIGGKGENMKYFSEETKKKMSESAKKRCTPEWKDNMSNKYSTALEKDKVLALYNAGLTQSEIAQSLGTTQKVIWRFMKNNNIKARIPAKRNQYGSNNSSWKGENALYGSFHQRVKYGRGKAKDYGCSVCGTKDNNKSYDWANLTGNYADITDYVPMCRSCHRKYDAHKVVTQDAREEINAF